MCVRRVMLLPCAFNKLHWLIYFDLFRRTRNPVKLWLDIETLIVRLAIKTPKYQKTSQF